MIFEHLPKTKDAICFEQLPKTERYLKVYWRKLSLLAKKLEQPTERFDCYVISECVKSFEGFRITQGEVYQGENKTRYSCNYIIHKLQSTESGKFDNVVSIFILPPSAEELLHRLTNRGTETKDSIRERMKEAIKELGEIHKYDYVIINDEVQKAFDKVNSAIDQEYMEDNVSFEVNRFKEELVALLRRI